ncbi:hypothetical protein V1509DRAFT_676563 [Lipomyces kononenkoae]
MDGVVHDFGKIDILILSTGGREAHDRCRPRWLNHLHWIYVGSAYNASKAGVIHLMKSLAAECAQYHIRCNAISPGYMDTPLNTEFEETYFPEWRARTPMRRLGQPEELDGCGLWLASSASTDILIDGGYTVI